jgi:hypothetical protein
MDQGREVEWPDVRGYTRYGKQTDAHGAFSEMEYEHPQAPYHSVTFEYFAWGGSAHKWSSLIGDKKLKGTWKGPKEIPRILQQVAKAAQQHEVELAKNVEKSLAGLAGSKWNFEWDEMMDEAIYSIKEDIAYSDAYLMVTLHDVSDVFEQGKKSRYSIQYAAGSDYAGAFGKADDFGSWGSVRDVAGILKKAERIWEKKKAEG